MNCRPKNKKHILLLLACAAIVPAHAEEQAEGPGTGTAPEDYIEKLLSAPDLSDAEARANYIEAAEIRQLTGDLAGAAELFKKASLAEKGRKDFRSLYRAAVIRVETADYRTAEADLRAITTFSDDLTLRIKAMILGSRIKMHQGFSDEARSIMTDILRNNMELPSEAYMWASELCRSEGSGGAAEGLRKLCIEKDVEGKAEYAEAVRMPSPETVFGLLAAGGAAEVSPDTGAAEAMTAAESTEDQAEEVPAAAENLVIQIGSFSRHENAEDLKITIGKEGYAAEIRKKTVDGREYSVVVVPVEPGKLQQTIISLKEKGFEGYPLY